MDREAGFSGFVARASLPCRNDAVIQVDKFTLANSLMKIWPMGRLLLDGTNCLKYDVVT